MDERMNELQEYASSLHLGHLSSHLSELLHKAQVDSPTYLEYTITIFKAEVEARKERELIRRIRRARLPRNCDLNRFDLNHGCGMTKQKLKQLRELLWVEQSFNLILMGPSGTGKTFLAAGLIHDVVSHRKNAEFRTMEEIVRILRLKDSSPKAMAAYNGLLKCAALCVDEITLMPLKREESVAFFHLINALHEKASVIITTNKAPTEWVEIFGDKDITAAILDRVLYHCEVIKLAGSSYRMDNRSGFLNKEQ